MKVNKNKLMDQLKELEEYKKCTVVELDKYKVCKSLFNTYKLNINCRIQRVKPNKLLIK